MHIMKNIGIYHSLIAQLDKLARHNRQGSFRTKERYYEAYKRFCIFLAGEFHLQTLNKVSGKHLVAYVLFLQERGKAASTIKTDLAAIRFFHDKLSDAKYRLPDNSELGIALERRRFGQLDRTWTAPEFNRMLVAALAAGREDYITALYLGRFAGLRIHECFRIDTATARSALRENAITIKGKGGKIRTVPIEDERIPLMLKKMLAKTKAGHKLLVPDDVPTDQAIHRLEAFIYDHRAEIQDANDSRPLTFHGLRHAYAAEKYQKLLDGGASALDASFAVSRLLGHERKDVTNIYTASVRRKGGTDGK